MKTIFLPVKVKREPNYEKVAELVSKIKERKIAICYSNQFIDVAKKLIEAVSDEKEVVKKCQVLGCSSPKFPEEAEAVIIIGQGKFHSVSLAYESGLPVYILEGEDLKKVSEKDIDEMVKKEKGAYLKYLNAEKIGILVTTKPGQERLSIALKFKDYLEKKEKKAYLFISNNIDVSEFENFGMDFWVNTACPRMDLVDAPLINLEKLIKLENIEF